MALLIKQTSGLLSFLRKQASRKLQASTLIEVLVASVLIIVVFSMASLTLNNVFKSTIKGNTHAVETQINKVLYLHQHDRIGLKYQENFNNWNITLSQQTENNTSFIIVEAINKGTKKIISKKMINESAQ